MNSALIFGLLIVLMLTGMPISIALGLTVLSYLFVLTTVPIEAVEDINPYALPDNLHPADVAGGGRK